MTESTVTLDDALRLLSLPRELGRHPDDGEPRGTNLGRFGPYVKHGDEFRSLESDDDVFRHLVRRGARTARAPKKSRRRQSAQKKVPSRHRREATARRCKLLAGDTARMSPTARPMLRCRRRGAASAHDTSRRRAAGRAPRRGAGASRPRAAGRAASRCQGRRRARARLMERKVVSRGVPRPFRRPVAEHFWALMTIHIIGGGLAGSRSRMAGGVARRAGRRCTRCGRCAPTEVHKTDGLAELVCSNSLRGDKLDNAVGLLKEEMRRLGSLIMRAADAHRVPAGAALAVDRERFSRTITETLTAHPLVTVVWEEIGRLPSDPRCIRRSSPPAR